MRELSTYQEAKNLMYMIWNNFSTCLVSIKHIQRSSNLSAYPGGYETTLMKTLRSKFLLIDMLNISACGRYIIYPKVKASTERHKVGLHEYMQMSRATEVLKPPWTINAAHAKLKRAPGAVVL